MKTITLVILLAFQHGRVDGNVEVERYIALVEPRTQDAWVNVEIDIIAQAAYVEEVESAGDDPNAAYWCGYVDALREQEEFLVEQH